MTSYQEAYEKMSLASASFLTANAAITTTLTGFTTYFPVIQTTHTQILTAKVQQEADRKGDTTSKNAIRATLITQAIDVDRRVVAYATNTNNNSLLELVNYTESELKKYSDQKLVSCCQVIRDSANANVAALATYGVTAAILTTLQTTITNFNAAIPKGRVVTTNSGEATQILANLFKTLTTNWAKIDTLVEMARTSQPNFYDEYQKVRKVIETGTGSLAMKVMATNAITGEPEANVTITFIPVNGQLKSAAGNGKSNIVKKTAKGGGAHVKNMPDGTYNYTAKKAGFNEENGTISVVNGEMTVLEIKMGKS
jgi:hypothetical protein